MDYDGSNFINGDYKFGIVADLEDMMHLYGLFSSMFDKENAGFNGANATIDTDVIHQCSSS